MRPGGAAHRQLAGEAAPDLHTAAKPNSCSWFFIFLSILFAAPLQIAEGCVKVFLKQTDALTALCLQASRCACPRR